MNQVLREDMVKLPKSYQAFWERVAHFCTQTVERVKLGFLFIVGLAISQWFTWWISARNRGISREYTAVHGYNLICHCSAKVSYPV